ncbi:MAG: 3'-5' exonuclease [Nitrospirales bacterium]|nr:3'-5' exonuclease [Nitrospirales bacterium]
MGILDFFRRKGPAIDRDMPITSAGYVVMDTELTGLDEKKDSIISMGAVRMKGGRICMGESFYCLVRPENGMRNETVVIHGITPSEVIDGKEIGEALDELTRFCGDDVIVGHFISIDTAFIKKEMKRRSSVALRNPVLDTYAMYEWLRSKGRVDHPQYCRLYEIAKIMNIPVEGSHNALVDAFITAQLFQRLIPGLLAAGVKEIGELLSIGHPAQGWSVPGIWNSSDLTVP